VWNLNDETTLKAPIHMGFRCNSDRKIFTNLSQYLGGSTILHYNANLQSSNQNGFISTVYENGHRDVFIITDNKIKNCEI
jgi:hypothetical protein